jgi:hypothetical protein
MQAEGTVRADGQPRAHFGDLRRLLEDPDSKPGALQAHARRQPADTAADDDDVTVIHERTLLAASDRVPEPGRISSVLTPRVPALIVANRRSDLVVDAALRIFTDGRVGRCA